MLKKTLTKIILPGFILLFANSCRNSGNQTETDEWLNEEIKTRIEVLNDIPQTKDSLFINPDEIDQEINNILLLSKDIENIQASVHRANMYFQKMSSRYVLNQYDFIVLRTDMHLDELATNLKQNELNLLNQLIFKTGKTGLPMYTAH